MSGELQTATGVVDDDPDFPLPKLRRRACAFHCESELEETIDVAR